MNIWTTNDSAIYTSGLGLSNITKRPKKEMTLLGGAIGTIASIWLYNNFIGWLAFLSATLPPIGTILILDYFLNREKFKQEEDKKMLLNYFAVAGVVLGALIANFVDWGIAPVNAMVVAAVCYLLGEKVFKKVSCLRRR
jgi:cytosine permease